MRVDAVTAPHGALLASLRDVLSSADEALVCVAFAQARGVHLIAKELRALNRARVMVTTTFGSTSEAALAAADELGAEVRVLNPGGGAYHPKVYLARRGAHVSALVGSANLTSGLVVNVEAATLMRGVSEDAPLAELWDWAERTWADPRAVRWEKPAGEPPPDEAIEAELLALIAAAARSTPIVYTLGPRPQENRVAEVTSSGLWVDTARARSRGTGPQLVPPRMLNLAWDALRARGRITNRELLDELRIHRSSFVCAILARVPGVRVVSSSPIELAYEPFDAAR